MDKMYYYRVLSPDFAELLQSGGKLRWLFDFVKKNERLDFLIGKNRSKEWISVYSGLTRLISIRKFKNSDIFIEADKAYQSIANNLYGRRNVNENFQNAFVELIDEVSISSQFGSYYENKKEGFHQTNFSRRFGMESKPDDKFVIIDKEAVIGYGSQLEKAHILGDIQKTYKNLQVAISQNFNNCGKDLTKKPIGNELDFLALDKNGNLLLIEFKHGTNCSGIYLSPLQIGLYYDIFTRYGIDRLEFTIFQMLAQKQRIGLLNPEWKPPLTIKKLIPVLIISEYKQKSSAKEKFNQILDFIRLHRDDSFLSDLQTYVYTPERTLIPW